MILPPKPMIHTELTAAINAQIAQELSASYHYLGMSTYFSSESLDGFSFWMLNQHLEEHTHAMKLLGYLQDRGGEVSFAALASPRTHFTSVLEVFDLSLQMEVENTQSINRLYQLADRLNDHATQSHLQWFLDEQVEEEKSIEDIIHKLKRINEDSAGLLYLDSQLSLRTPEATN